MTKSFKKIDPDVHFKLLHFLENDSSLTQRELAQKIGISLGSVNYCLKNLIHLGHIKIGNFKNNPNKTVYLYLLTPQGIYEKASLTSAFLERKMAEYYSLKQEIDSIQSKIDR